MLSPDGSTYAVWGYRELNFRNSTLHARTGHI